MGMFDCIEHEMPCPNCNKKIEINEQIKWTNKRRCIRYSVGDKIDAADGEYTFATRGRPELYVYCKSCGHKINYKTIVNNGKLLAFEPVV